jgi:hypothetical protein
LLTTTTMEKVACPITSVTKVRPPRYPVNVPALWRRDPGDPPAGDAVLHRLPDLPLGVLLLNG